MSLTGFVASAQIGSLCRPDNVFTLEALRQELEHLRLPDHERCLFLRWDRKTEKALIEIMNV